MSVINASQALVDVHYSIRGPLANRAHELEAAGHSIIKLNIGNPGVFGFRSPDSMHEMVRAHLIQSESYCHQKGLPHVRDAIAAYHNKTSCTTIEQNEVFVGNGVSELILMALRALLNKGDEVLVPSPGYPLWTAAVFLSDGKAIHYPCLPENGYVPNPEDIEALITDKTRAIVIINPNNPTGSVYPESVIKEIAAIAERHQIIAMSDEIYDQILFDEAQHFSLNAYVNDTLCMTFSGLSKVHRACGYRVGWLCFGGKIDHAKKYIDAVELLASLRLCSNVPTQWAVPVAIDDTSVRDLVSQGGRLYKTRQALSDAVKKSRFLMAHIPEGALYCFVGVRLDVLPNFNDEKFGLDLLEKQHVLVAPGKGFNIKEQNYFRVTLLPNEADMREVFIRINNLLEEYAAQEKA